MKRRSSLPIFIILWAIYILATSIILNKIKAQRFEDTFFYVPYIILTFYFMEKTSSFGPEKWKFKNTQKTFQNVSTLPVRERMVFWVSAFGISVISLLEGFFLQSATSFLIFLLLFLNLIAWTGVVYWINLRNNLLIEKNNQRADQNK